nr:acyltransferase family protein [Mangrovicoccus ximenensis]
MGATASYPLDDLFSPYNLLFPMGMLAAATYRSLSAPAGAALALCGLALFLAIGLADVTGAADMDHGIRTLIFGAGLASVVAGLAALELHGMLAAPRLLSFLGDASYAIYLVHGVALAVGAKVVLALGINAAAPPWTSFALLILGGVAAGASAHVLVERPLTNALRRRAGI